jgi:hypothetical protein
MKFDRGAILSIAGAIILIVGIFLPWATSSSPGGNLIGGATSWSESGWTNYSSDNYQYLLVKIALVLGAIGAILIVIKKRLTVIAGLATGVFTLMTFLVLLINLNNDINNVNSYHLADISTGIAYGIWVSIIGSLLLIAGGVLAFKDTKKVASSQTAPSETQQSPQ